jgi:glycosyltransferase involved in cell wall biosynthesis
MKKRILFLVPYPLGEAPSQRFRFEQYFDALKQRGFEYDVQSFLDDATWKILYKPGNALAKVMGILKGFLRRLLVFFHLHNYDMVFIHREASPVGPPVFEWLIAKVFDKKYIYDFDDAVWLPNTSATNSFAAKIKWHSKAESICRWAFRCSCGNDFLADYARQFNPNVVVNPTTIDMEHHHNQPKNQNDLPVSIGWTGTLTTMKYLDEIVPVLKELEKEIDFSFIVISNKPPEFTLKGLQFVQWKKETEVEDLLRFHVGIMPLTDDDWSRGKCGFKALQYMSLGIPAIVSPVGVNTKIVDDAVNGFVSNHAATWKKAISDLLSNNELRKQFSTRAIEKIKSNYSVQSNTANFIALFGN